MSEKKKIFMCGLCQESNAFNPIFMPLSNFHRMSMETSGYGDDNAARVYLSTQNVECTYGVSLHSNSGGPLADEVVEFFINDTVEKIKNAGELDGVLLLLHGATMSESCGDVCGYICETVRQLVGEKAIISAYFDLHGNITEKIAENVDIICGYLEYPHIDRNQTSERAARLLCDMLFGAKYKLARAAVPSIAPANAYTTTSGALKTLKEKAKAMVASGKIIDYSVFQVQPWLDTPVMSSAAIVIANDEQTAIDAANELALDSFNSRVEIQGSPLLSISDVIEKALNNKSGKPIILADSADSIGAGSPGDCAQIVAELLPYSDRLRAATDVRDIPTVRKAFEVGVGNTAEFFIGASAAPNLSKPVQITAKVKSLHDGYFIAQGPISKGALVGMGKTAVLQINKLYIRVSEQGNGAFDANAYRSFGIPVELCDIISIKACTSFKASYASFTDEIYNASTPGAACPDLLSLDYKERPKPLYPFEEITEDDIAPAKIYR